MEFLKGIIISFWIIVSVIGFALFIGSVISGYMDILRIGLGLLLVSIPTLIAIVKEIKK